LAFGFLVVECSMFPSSEIAGYASSQLVVTEWPTANSQRRLKSQKTINFFAGQQNGYIKLILYITSSLKDQTL
jgi:hypothetical protein